MESDVLLEVNLWFARDLNNEIVSVLDANIHNNYHCPVCTSKVIPKALESKKITPHFAHIDVSKCNGEAMIHWWYKNKFIQQGDKFTIVTDKEIEFTCKDYSTEVTYQLTNGTYRPDLVVYTECGQEIVFEMANTNKKMVKDYIDRWIELDRIIVEVDIKALQNVNEIKQFNALYYRGKCFNFNKRDGGYYNTIGKLKEEMQQDGKYDIELVRKLDWFWDNVRFYLKNKNNEYDLFESIIHIIRSDEKYIYMMIDILNKHKEFNIINKFCENQSKMIEQYILNNVSVGRDIKFSIDYSYSKVFDKFILNVNFNTKHKKNDSYFYVRRLHFENKESLDFEKINSQIVNTLEAYEHDLVRNKLKDMLENDVKTRLDNVVIKINKYLEKNMKVKANISVKESIEITLELYYLDYVIKTFEFKLNDDNSLESIISDEVINYITNINKNILQDIQKVQSIKEINYKKDETYSKYFININITNLSNIINIYLDMVGDYQKVYTFDSNQITKKEHWVENGEFIRRVSTIKSLWDDVKNEIIHSVINSLELIQCRECDCSIELNEKEIDFYLENNLCLPKRCKSCRKKRKQGGIK